jgi:hypothetical protein
LKLEMNDRLPICNDFDLSPVILRKTQSELPYGNKDICEKKLDSAIELLYREFLND